MARLHAHVHHEEREVCPPHLGLSPWDISWQWLHGFRDLRWQLSEAKYLILCEHSFENCHIFLQSLLEAVVFLN